ncbi:MAG: DUF3179 domain-containing protein, partial [Planctomycetia bacterium]|nr:DUF3179 domain-containing protein [Planctomycetia bacterium]
VVHLFDRTIAGQTLDFEQVDAATMKDRQTDSQWSILSGRAIGGAMNGKRLTPRVGIMSFKSAWENFHPESKPIDF